jgi:hypothetical protein
MRVIEAMLSIYTPIDRMFAISGGSGKVFDFIAFEARGIRPQVD